MVSEEYGDGVEQFTLVKLVLGVAAAVLAAPTAIVAAMLDATPGTQLTIVAVGGLGTGIAAMEVLKTYHVGVLRD